MVSYKVIISPKALSQLEDYINYIQFTLFNKQAANAVWHDAIETVNELETVADSLRKCGDPKLRNLKDLRLFTPTRGLKTMPLGINPDENRIWIITEFIPQSIDNEPLCAWYAGSTGKPPKGCCPATSLPYTNSL